MKKKKKTDMLTLYILFGTLAVFWILFQGVVFFFFREWDHRGLFGDSFGAINSLFSGLAFAGIIYTILLQRNELELQRQELVFTRKELERSAIAQEKSEAALKDQAQFLKEQTQAMQQQVQYLKEQSKALKEQSEAMTRSARLNAINTIVAFYSQSGAASQQSNWNWYVQATQKASKYVKVLEDEIEKDQ